MAKEEEGKISPAVIVPLAIAGLIGIGGLAYAATRAEEPPEEEPPTVYTCPTCGAQFSKEAELLTHIASEHPPVVYYTCPTCGAQFAIESDLITHIETEHPEAPPVIYYTCSACGATFVSQTELDTHTISEHPGDPDLSGIFEISSGVYETRWPDGTVISTTYVTYDAVTIYGGAWGDPQIFPRGTKKYDVTAAYFAAQVDGVRWSQGEWDKYINMYYYVRRDDTDWSDWDESSMTGRRTAYYWFTVLIPRYCPLTWNP